MTSELRSMIKSKTMFFYKDTLKFVVLNVVFRSCTFSIINPPQCSELSDSTAYS